jgi:choice-of-anchor A domain-containing protein
LNGQLVVDFGGVHTPESTTYTPVDLVDGENCTLDIFTAQRHTSGSELHISTNMPLNTAAVNIPAPGRTAYICDVVFQNFCPNQPIPTDTPSRQTACPADPSLTFGASTYSFDNFNVISFDSFYAISGDVEGRGAIRNNLNLPYGQYSFGYQLRTGGSSAIDQSLPYSLVVGRDFDVLNIAVYPDGTNFPYAGTQEDIFVGGVFTNTPQYIQDIATGHCPTADDGCLDSDFDNAQAYYTLLSSSFAGVTDNAVAAVDQTGLFVITCTDVNALAYSVTVDASVFNTLNDYSEVNCNAGAQLVINVVGTADVTFQGNNIQHTSELVLYNIVGTGRTVSVFTEIDGSVLAPNNFLAQSGGVIKGIVIVGTVSQALQINRLECSPPAPPPHPQPNTTMCPTFETACSGLDFPLSNGVYSFRDFNVISFLDFTAATGDIEGRLAVRRNANLGAGYSVGYELQTVNNAPDNYLPYSVVVGGDLTWISGNAFPNGNGIPYAGEEEDIFVGGVFTGPTDLSDRVLGGPCASTGCLDAFFDSALSCYRTFQSTELAYNDNAVQSSSFSGMFVTCNDATENTYYIKLTASDLAAVTYFSTSNCNFQANWVINIIGTDDVTFTGGSFPAPAGAVLYNVIGSGRTIYVHDTDLNGHLLAPDNFLNQTNGVIHGKVVVGNVLFSLQINKEDICQTPGNVTLTTVSTGPCTTCTSVTTPGDGGLVPGDTASIDGGQNAVITAVTATSITFDSAVTVKAGSKITATVDGASGRGAAPTATSGVAQIAASFALLFAVLLF